MTENRRTVERYIEAFNRADHDLTESCLTDDVEWVVPGAFQLQGRAAFRKEAEKVGPDRIVVTVSRVVEENDVVIAEGAVNGKSDDGQPLSLVFCDVFEMRGGKIGRLTSYVVNVK